MIRTIWNTKLVFVVICVFSLGCSESSKRLKQAFVPTDVRIIRYHVDEYYKSLEEFTRRLYLKNPKYENYPEMREKKIRGVFHGGKLPNTKFNHYPSNEILDAAFGSDTVYEDRVFLLALGLAKSIQEAYETGGGVHLSSIEIPLEKLKNLYHNMNQVDWRLKTYRRKQGKLLFLTNAPGKNNYINMGFEVIMTKILTRIEDDIFLCSGAPPKLAFTVSTLFLPILIF